MKRVLDYIENERERYLEELTEYLKIPSISDLPEHKEDVRKAAEMTVKFLKDAGMENVRQEETAGHPIVYGDWLHAGKDKPTVLVYGHYDVQPVDPLDEWDTPPFEPTVRDGKIFGRGTSDDKGQVFVHIKALEAMLKNTGSIPTNVKIIIEGEEEAGSNHLDEFIESHSEMLAADTVLISDTEWFADGLPSICYALRGISYFQVNVEGPFQDLHSGTYGGAVDNPCNVLCSMMAKLKDEYGRITIPGFYEDVLELEYDEREGFTKLPFDHKQYCERLNVPNTRGEHGYSVLEQTWARPSLDINGLTGGFQGDGAKTVLPKKASAKFSMRLVPHQNPADIAAKTVKYLKELAPPTVRVEVVPMHDGAPVLFKRKGDALNAAMGAFEEAFNTKPVYMREGGSIPVTGQFQSVLGADSVLFGLGLPGDNIHGPNENFDLENFYGGIKASVLFFEKYGK